MGSVGGGTQYSADLASGLVWAKLTSFSFSLFQAFSRFMFVVSNLRRNVGVCSRDFL